MIEIRGGIEAGRDVLLRQPRPEEIARSIDELKQELAQREGGSAAAA